MRICVLCSGGDAPGMNACVRAIVRSASMVHVDVIGIRHGYRGLIEGDFRDNSDGTFLMSPRSVSHIIQRGGTILRTARCDEFLTESGQESAAETLRRNHIDGLVVIGGDGSFRGAVELGKRWEGGIIGCPGTIDNDLAGTDHTIGFQTAVTTAVEAIDKLRDTAESHERLFLVEVMGRDSGCLALYTALASGAEFACVPETPTNPGLMVQQITAMKRRGKSSIIIVVSEGDEDGGAGPLGKKLTDQGCPYSIRTVKLGHVQRGGAPCPADRILASRLGDFALRSLLAGNRNVMAGEVSGQLAMVPLEEALAQQKVLSLELLQLLERMSA